MPKFCSNCGAPAGAGKFCGQCGAQLLKPDPYADGNTTPAEKELWFKKNAYVPPDHTTAPQIKTVPSLTGQDGSVYVPPTTSEFRAQVTQGERLPAYTAPDHASGIPILKEEAKPMQPPAYRPPDHTTGIPVVKEKVGPVNPGVWKPDHSDTVPTVKENPEQPQPGNYRAHDHVSNIPVLKEKVDPVHAPEYKAPDHNTNIPILKEKAEPVRAPGYQPPDHTKVPVIKTVPTPSGAEIAVVVAPGQESANSAPISPRSTHVKKYQPPDHTKGIPVVKEQVAPQNPGIWKPDHSDTVPVVKERPDVSSPDGVEYKAYIAPVQSVGSVSPRGTQQKKYQPPDHTSGIPVVKEDPSKYKGYVQW